MSSNQFTYFLGGTNVVLGLSTMVKVSVPEFGNFVQIGAVTGSTSSVIAYMAPIPTQGSTPTVGSGVNIGAFGAGQIKVQGPAGFWLSAAGVTASVSMIFGVSSSYGQSFFP